MKTDNEFNINMDEKIDFNKIFGDYHEKVEKEYDTPMCKIEIVEDEFAQPCSKCGCQPEVHIADFEDKISHPKNVYICCSHCSKCDGEWYEDKESAIIKWNTDNFGSKPRDPSSPEDMHDFIKRIMKDVKIQ